MKIPRINVVTIAPSNELSDLLYSHTYKTAIKELFLEDNSFSDELKENFYFPEKSPSFIKTYT